MGVSNVKVSWRCPQHPRKPTSGHSTFHVPPFTYTLFHHGFVNCTGIPSLDQVSHARDIFYREATSPPGDVSIDNITYTAHAGHSLALWRLAARRDLPGLLLVRYNPLIFPGATFRFERPAKGSIVAFASGAFNILGCNNLKDISSLEEHFRQCCEHEKSHERDLLQPSPAPRPH